MTAGVITRHGRGYRRRLNKKIAHLPQEEQRAILQQDQEDQSRRRKSLIAAHQALMKSRTS